LSGGDFFVGGELGEKRGEINFGELSIRRAWPLLSGILEVEQAFG